MLTIYIQSLGKYLFRSFARILLRVFYIALYDFLTYFENKLHVIHTVYKDFLQFHRLPFILLTVSFVVQDVLFCGYLFYFVTCAFVIYLKIIATTNAKELFLIFSPGSFMVSGNSKRTRNRKGT